MTSINLENVSVRYPIETSARQRSAFAQLARSVSFGGMGGKTRHNSYVEAVSNLSLTVSEGGRLGLIGRNGAGKSTLLKMIAGIYEPSAGRREVIGRLGCLLSPGAGMDSDLTGLENLRLVAMFHGLRGKEMRDVVDRAAEFSELGPYLEMPVRTYSTGMNARLCFSIATSQQTDILLVDEVIGAGDMFFINKAVARIRELCSRAGIVVMSSHSYEIVASFCTHVLLLDAGRALAFGKIDDVWPQYEAMHGLAHNEPAPRPAEDVVVAA